MPVQIDSPGRSKINHIKKVGGGDDFVNTGTQSNNSLDTQFGSLWAPFTVLSPWASPALPGLPMAS